jgi:CubicO group peptidase (beta-lactamase class C family)
MRRLRHWALSTSVVLATIAGGFAGSVSPAQAGTKSLHPDGGGVPTTQTDATQFKNCQEPPADSLWEQAKAGDVGLDAAKLQAAADYYRDQLQASMRVYRFNCLVQTGHFDPVMERYLTHMFSTTKPTMTLVAGIAIRKGLLSVDDTVGKFFPDQGDDAHRAVTVKQLLQHTSGLEMHWPTELNDGAPDTVDRFMSLKFVHEPGTYYQYSQTGCNMMSAIVEKAVGEKFQVFAQRELFDKIGILKGNYFWSKDRAGWSYGYSGLYLRPIDMVRIGTLELQGGVYRGERIVDEQFVKDMATGSDVNPGFGYNTWVNAAPHSITVAINSRQELKRPIIASAPHDMYFSWGWRGRHIFVIPTLGMVVTVTPFDGQVPCPGAVCTFLNGYPGQGPGSGPGAQSDGHQVGQAELNKGYHDFFRILMSAVSDQKVPDPGEWDEPDDNEFDPDGFFGNPEGQMKSSGFGQKMENYPPYFADYAALPEIYARNMSTK